MVKLIAEFHFAVCNKIIRILGRTVILRPYASVFSVSVIYMHTSQKRITFNDTPAVEGRVTERRIA